MRSEAFKPRSFTEIVDAAFQIFRTNYAKFIMCAAIGYAPLLVLQLALIGDPARFMQTAAFGGEVLIGGGVTLLASLIVYALMSSVIIACASQAYLGDPVDVAVAVRHALPRLPRVILAELFRLFFYMVGFLAFVFTSVYVYARLFAVIPTIVLEDASVTGAFSRTAALSRGRKWHILNTLGLVTIIYYVLGFGVSAVVAFTGNYVVQAIATTFYTILLYPVIGITEALLYYDARIQSEGLDIELMVDEMAPETPAR